MIEEERARVNLKNTRSQSIIMQDFHERKARMNLDKKISKKVQRAEKNKEKAVKDQVAKLRTKLLAPVEVIQAK